MFGQGNPDRIRNRPRLSVAAEGNACRQSLLFAGRPIGRAVFPFDAIGARRQKDNAQMSAPRDGLGLHPMKLGLQLSDSAVEAIGRQQRRPVRDGDRRQHAADGQPRDEVQQCEGAISEQNPLCPSSIHGA